jgi:hypothetical protein
MAETTRPLWYLTANNMPVPAGKKAIPDAKFWAFEGDEAWTRVEVQAVEPKPDKATP